MMNKRLYAVIVPLLAITVLLVLLNRPVASVEGEDKFNFLPLVLKPCGRGDLIYSDDFSDPESGWGSFETDQVKAGYHEGEYRLLAKVANVRLGLANTDNAASDYVLEVNLRNINGKPGQYGVIFGFEGALELDFYTFMIAPTGDYFIYYNEQNIPDPLQRTLLQSGWSAAIRTGSASNKLAVTHSASYINFHVNDRFVTTMLSDRDGSAQSGMMSKAGNQPNLDVRYDNFKVFRYLCSDGQTSIVAPHEAEIADFSLLPMSGQR